MVDLFLVSFLSIKTSPNNNKNVAWIKGNIYDHWYCELDIFGSSLIVEVTKLIVDGEAAAATIQKDKGILLETANKAQEETFWPAMTKLLRTYMIFAMDSPDFFQAYLHEIVICKNNSMRIPLNPNFDSLILKFGRSARTDALLQPENIKEDHLAPSTREQEEMKVNVLNTDLGVEEKEKEIQSNLGL